MKKKPHANPNEQVKEEATEQVLPETEAEEVLNEETTAQQAEASEAVQEPEAQAADPEAEQLRAKLAEAEKQRDEYLTLAQRVQADFDNFRRRNQNVRKESFDDGARSFAATLLPVIDNLERAIAAAAASPDESLKSGVEMVCRQMLEAFEKRGITPIDRLGEPFDPNLENAVMKGTPEEGEPGTVCAVFQKGYQMDGKLLRAAMVKVVSED